MLLFLFHVPFFFLSPGMYHPENAGKNPGGIEYSPDFSFFFFSCTRYLWVCSPMGFMFPFHMFPLPLQVCSQFLAYHGGFLIFVPGSALIFPLLISVLYVFLSAFLSPPIKYHY
jgi:hypothetical protein